MPQSIVQCWFDDSTQVYVVVEDTDGLPPGVSHVDELSFSVVKVNLIGSGTQADPYRPDISPPYRVLNIYPKEKRAIVRIPRSPPLVAIENEADLPDYAPFQAALISVSPYKDGYKRRYWIEVL